MRHFNLIIACFLLAVAPAFGQNTLDSVPAYRVCSSKPLLVRVAMDKSLTTQSEELELHHFDCFGNSDEIVASQTLSLLRLTIKQTGTLAFTITPTHPEEDIDFVVMKYSKGAKKKQVVRCMAAGSPDPDSPCRGATGLAAPETDTKEDAGCADYNDNNWLAPIAAKAGEEYLILIANISSLRDRYRVEFTGDAVIDCASAVR